MQAINILGVFEKVIFLIITATVIMTGLGIFIEYKKRKTQKQQLEELKKMNEELKKQNEILKNKE